MIRSVTEDIEVADGAEETKTVVTAQEGKKITIKNIVAELDDDVTVRGYVNQDRIVEAGLGCDALANMPIPVDRPLAIGETWKTGFHNDSGGSVTLQVTTFYEEN